ncbi:cyclase family protein [Amycolatopsis benzoatilytica]|uniref:cyclase family protein n=1 Tax=Amycolatopsis benzoatilytica TaxID=346045 RepID=UPI00037BA8F9|nr:cyclase family protein [Amycolatopsis benzoatilytica]
MTFDDVSVLPAYRDLPRLEDIGSNHSWGVFGDEDDFGTLNLLTSARVRDAARSVRTGERVGLSLPLHEPDPPLFRREPYRHTVKQLGSMWDDRLDTFFPQGSTQWDGFRHHRVRQHGFYGGVTDDPAPGNPRLSVHHWGRTGIVGRGVLIDLAAHLLPGGYDPLAERPITAEEVRAAAAAQGVEVRPGDVLCLRTGWLRAYRALSPEAKAEISAKKAGLYSAGLRADEEIAELLWDWHIAAVAVDNPAVEATPGDPAVGSLHRRVLAMLGIPLGELFDFEALAEKLAGPRDFLFTAVPLTLVGGLGSPGNAIAVL